MRPASLVQSALPDLERPAMTRAIAAKDTAKLSRMLRDFRFALVAVWLVTVAAGGGDPDLGAAICC